MRNYMRALMVIGVVNAYTAAAQQGSCARIPHGRNAESFVSRISCARQAINEGNALYAYELLEPIYQDARNKTSKTQSQSQAKLADIVRLQLSEKGNALIAHYGVEDVYAALAQAADIDPATGKRATIKRTLPPSLVESVAATQPRVQPKKSQPRAPSQTQPVTPQKPLPQPARSGTELEQELVFTPKEQDALLQVERQPIKVFALNTILDSIFFAALTHNDWDVCQNLISAIKNEKDIPVITDLVAVYNQQGGDAQTTYSIFKDKLASYKITQWLGLGNKAKTAEELLDLWVEAGPSLPLLIALQKNNAPTEEQEREAGLYMLRQNQGTSALRVSKVIMLMRSAKSLLFEPEGSIKTPIILTAFGTVLALYQALRTALINNNYSIATTTQFNVEGASITLNELDTQLAEIIQEELVRVIMENEELERQGYTSRKK